MELLDGNTRESNILKELNKATTILNNNDKYLPNLPNLKANQAKKIDEKAKKHQLKKDTLANVTFFYFY